MKFSLLLILPILTTHCNDSRTKDKADFDAVVLSDAAQYDLSRDFFETLIEEQKQIVSTLTGSSEINSDSIINRRWTMDEKRLARNYLSGLIEGIHQLPQEHRYETKLPDKYKNASLFKGVNLYTIIPSTVASSEYVIIGAHYDTFEDTPGADDNASGCALVYGVGKMLTRLEKRSKNIILVFLDEEETGHAGSLAFANWVKAQKLEVHSVHTADEVGWDQDQDRNIELELPTPYLESLYKKHAEPFDIRVYTTKTTGSDHREFREAGFQAVGISEEYKNGDANPHHHKPSDTFEKIDYQFLAFTTYLVFKVVEDVSLAITTRDSLGQGKNPVESDTAILIEPMVPPSFPGGQAALNEYIDRNFNWKQEQLAVEGSVFVEFWVDVDGKIREAKLVRGLCGSCDKEALRLVKNMPAWIAGRANGKTVKMKMIMPIRFGL